MGNPKMQSPSQGNKRTGRSVPANNAVLRAAYMAENGNEGNFEAVESHGTAFAPKQCLYQRVAVGMENTKMQSPSRCNKRSWHYGPANNAVSRAAYRSENGNVGNFKAVESHDTAFAPKQCSYQKVAVGMENRKMQSLSRCNKRTGCYDPAPNAVLAGRV